MKKSNLKEELQELESECIFSQMEYDLENDNKEELEQSIARIVEILDMVIEVANNE